MAVSAGDTMMTKRTESREEWQANRCDQYFFKGVQTQPDYLYRNKQNVTQWSWNSKYWLSVSQ